MRSPSKGRVVETLVQLRAALRHAFAAQPDSYSLTLEEVELMERVAGAIVKRGMAAPATVFLESMGPMNFLGSQALHFLTPIIECACNTREVEQVARLLERRDSVPRLIAIIEAKSSVERASAE
jgi:hypothetical protein